MRSPSLVLVFALSACVDTTISTFDQPPVVVIQLPGDGAEFNEGAAIEFVGKVADDGDIDDLLLTWIDNGSTPLAEGAVPDAEGFVRFTTSDLAPGSHAVALRAVDVSNLSAEAAVQITIVDVIDDPSLTIVRPTTTDVGEAAVERIFEVTVSDPQDPAEALVVELESDLDGSVCTMPVGSDGVGLCRAALRTVGDHRLTFSVTDTDGNTTTKSTIFPVAPVPEAPSIQMITPTPGSSVLQDTILEFRALVGDRQDAPQALAVDMQSDVEGYLCPFNVDPQGNAVCYQSLSVMGNQFLTVRVLDPDGNTAETTVLVRVTDASGIDDDGDGFAEVQGDCNDADATVFPGGPELPDVRDNDCDGFIDEGTILVDDDGDGYCESLAQPCSDGAVGGDCNDAASWQNPGQFELCGDAIDSNCNGTTADIGASGCIDFYIDADQDSFGAQGSSPQCQCGPNGNYTASNNLDCQDASNQAYPGAPELADGYDNDCDGLFDEQTSRTDDDRDGYCDDIVCSDGSQPGDCDDARPNVNPGAPEVCDAFDNDCDALTNEINAQGCTNYYLDADGDNYGSAATVVCACSPPTAQAVLLGGDCDDGNVQISPSAQEVADGIDNNCNGHRDEGTNRYDDDGDGYCESNCTIQPWQAQAWLSGDCNDGSATVSPGASEVCANGVDDNCNQQVNEGQNAVGCTMFYRDNDFDGYGGGVGACYCQATGQYQTTNNTDCYDSNQWAKPGQTSWFTGHRGDGSFDYNCDGRQEKHWEAIAVCDTNNFFVGLVCGQPQDGWLDDDAPACGQSAEWVYDCDYNGNGITSLFQCLLEVNKDVNSSTTVQQNCR